MEEKEIKTLIEEITAKLLTGHVIVALAVCEVGLDISCELLTYLATNNKLSPGACKEYAKRMWDHRVLIKRHTSEIKNGNFNPTLQEEHKIMEGLKEYSDTLKELDIIYKLNPDLH